MSEAGKTITNAFMEGAELIDRLRKENAELNKLVHAPGAWHCEKCGFVLQKSILHAQTGSVSANNEPFNEKCPNDGQLMKPLTWKKMSEDNFKAGSEALQRERKLREVLELACIAACECMTKTPDPQYHAESCRYKKYREALLYDGK